MGNEASGFIFINLNSPVYSAGEYVKGQIYVKIPSDTNSESLRIKFTGKEVLEFESGGEKYMNMQEILNYDIEVHKWPNQIVPQADYIFPFEIYLPRQVPGSSSLILSNALAIIEYKLEAYINTELNKVIPVVVKSYQDFPDGPNKSDSEIVFKRCCSWIRETLSFQVKVNKFFYTTSEVIKITFQTVSTRIRTIRIGFYRSLLLTSYTGKIFIDKKCLFEIDTDQAEFDLDLKNFEDRLSTQCSTKGKAISCTYSLSVAGIVASGCSKYDSEVILWVIINPVATSSVSPRYSLSWKPINMNGVKFREINLNEDNVDYNN
jgi:Arrestin (or S-antigen), N-terminal domain